MTAIGEVIVCGKRGGPSFLNTIRVNPQTFECPIGYEPCSKATSPSETVCWPVGESKENCPIVDILVIETESQYLWESKGYKTTENTFVQSSNSSAATTRIAFSKEQNRDKTEGARQPIISSSMNT